RKRHRWERIARLEPLRDGARSDEAALDARNGVHVSLADLWLPGRRGHPPDHRQDRWSVLRRGGRRALNLDLWIGLPEHEEHRVAPVFSSVPLDPVSTTMGQF